uniref:Putative group i salivary lipocalin n=1 Tax=Rhipicephalus pulchellus TaxID=72859 RepID=L7LQK6_RHIPC
MRSMEIHFMDMILVCALLVLNHANRAASNQTKEEEHSLGKLNITEFYHTRRPIWTIITTANDSLDCQVDQKEFMNDTDIYFSRKGRTRTVTDIMRLHGKFVLPRKMNVGPKSRPPDCIEELIHEHRKSCGVFKLGNITNGTKYHAYEIRVRDYGGYQSAQACLNWFNKTYRGETFKRRLYQTSCRSITRINMLG